MRVLVTGSRDWADEQTIRDALARVTQRHGHRHVIVHGDCPTGADAMAEQIAQAWGGGMTTEPHPADWDRYGRAAGPLRNAEMVALGADLCLAFIGDCTSPRCNVPGKHLSHGASGCADLAEAAGIPVRRWTS